MAQTIENGKGIKTIRELMGMEPDVFVIPTTGPGVPSAVPLPVADQLPILKEEPEAVAAQEEGQEPVEETPVDMSHFASPLSRLLARDWVRYPLLFAVALGFFYVILNFRSISAQLSAFVSPPGKKEQAVLAQISPEYQAWLKKYYVFVNDPQILQPNEDPDRDGLTNMQEFYLGTNPLKVDTDDDGYTDGQEILNGYNPLYEGRLKAWQQDAIAEHIDKEGVRSRLALKSVQKVAGEEIGSTIGGGFQVDPAKAGRIAIPKLGIDAPVIWTQDFSKMEEDLKHGATHHPATPYPGQWGTVSIHGHSSGNPWDGDYQTLFTRVNFLQAGDEIFVTVYNTSGESRRYRYIVRSAKVYAKNDPAQFATLDGYFLNLSTSWPVGTAQKRYVVTTELAGL